MPANPKMFAQFMRMIQGGQNPQQIAINMLQNRAGGNNPMFQNLLSMAMAGNTAEIEQFARNLSREQGIDFDSEFNAFKNNLGV